MPTRCSNEAKLLICQIPFILLLIVAMSHFCRAQDATLKQERAIPLDGVEGRIDHMYISPDGRRLFVAEIGNNSVEVLNPQDGTHVTRIEGIKEPQGVVYIPESKRLVVASGGDSNVRIYNEALTPIGTIGDLEDADNARYDAQTKLAYVGYTAALAVIDPEKMVKVADISLDGHAESFRLEERGNRIFVNVPGAKEIEVIDRAKREVIAKWPMTEAQSNFPMILDEEHHRLLVACRRPAKMVAIDTETGKVVATTDCVSGTDDLFYDATHKRIYVTGSGGTITVIEQTDADHYRVVENFKTAPGAQTSFFAPDSGLLYLAVPHRNDQKAEIRVYKVAG